MPIGLTGALHVRDALIATTTNSSAYSTATAAAPMENASALQDSVAKTVLNRCAAHWQMARIDRHGKETNATAKTAGKESTAMSVPITEPVMP